MFLAHFWSIFPILVAKIFFLENLALPHTTSHQFLAPYQNLEKTNDAIPRKCPDRWKDERKDGQTLLYRTLPATAGGPFVISFAEVYLSAYFSCTEARMKLFTISLCAYIEIS